MNKNIGLLYTTIGIKEEAENLAKFVLSSKQAICVNIISGGHSLFLWQGKLEQNTEYYMLFKTTVELLDELEATVLQNHPYDVPVILKWLCEANEKFYEYTKKNLLGVTVFSQD